MGHDPYLAATAAMSLTVARETRDGRDRRDLRETRDGRDRMLEVGGSKFEIQKTSNFGPRTLARPAFPASLACLARLSCVMLVAPDHTRRDWRRPFTEALLYLCIEPQLPPVLLILTGNDSYLALQSCPFRPQCKDLAYLILGLRREPQLSPVLLILAGTAYYLALQSCPSRPQYKDLA